MTTSEKRCVQCDNRLPSVFDYCPNGGRPGSPSIVCHSIDEQPQLMPPRGETESVAKKFAVDYAMAVTGRDRLYVENARMRAACKRVVDDMCQFGIVTAQAVRQVSEALK